MAELKVFITRYAAEIITIALVLVLIPLAVRHEKRKKRFDTLKAERVGRMK